MKKILKITNRKLKAKDGVALYLSILVLSAIFSIGFGITSLLLGQLKISRDVGKFIPAIYAADSGIERALYKIRANGDFASCTTSGPPAECEITVTTMDNGATYEVVVLDFSFEWCSAANKCIHSIGRLNEANRALEANF